MGYLNRKLWQGHADAHGFDLRSGAEASYRFDEASLGADRWVVFGVDFDNFSRFQGTSVATKLGDRLVSTFVRFRVAAGLRVFRISPYGDEFLVLAKMEIAKLKKEPWGLLRALLDQVVVAGSDFNERAGFTVGTVELKVGHWPVPEGRAALDLCKRLKSAGRRGCVGWLEGGAIAVFDPVSGMVESLRLDNGS